VTELKIFSFLFLLNDVFCWRYWMSSFKVHLTSFLVSIITFSCTGRFTKVGPFLFNACSLCCPSSIYYGLAPVHLWLHMQEGATLWLLISPETFLPLGLLYASPRWPPVGPARFLCSFTRCFLFTHQRKLLAIAYCALPQPFHFHFPFPFWTDGRFVIVLVLFRTFFFCFIDFCHDASFGRCLCRQTGRCFLLLLRVMVILFFFLPSFTIPSPFRSPCKFGSSMSPSFV